MTYSCLSLAKTTARKPHVCVWCCNDILLGSIYLRERSVADGYFQNFAWHEACNKDADSYFADTGDDTFISGNEMPFLALYKLERTLLARLDKKGDGDHG